MKKETLAELALDTIEQMKQLSASETDLRHSESAEMKLIQAIHENEGMHVIGLASVLGITKGAVSQTLAKLERKGLIRKVKDSKNASRLNILLSDRGKELFSSHEAYHRELNELADGLIAQASPECAEFLLQFMTQIRKKQSEEWAVLEEYLSEGK